MNHLEFLLCHILLIFKHEYFKKSIFIISKQVKKRNQTKLHLFPSVNLRIQPQNNFQKLLKQYIPVIKSPFYAFQSQKCAYLCSVLSDNFLLPPPIFPSRFF